MATRIFKKDFLVDELDIPWDNTCIKMQEIDHTSRWSIHYRLVFEFEGKNYLTHYSVAATESQDEGPWEYVDEVTCTEVEEKEVMVKQWFPVEEK